MSLLRQSAVLISLATQSKNFLGMVDRVKNMKKLEKKVIRRGSKFGQQLWSAGDGEGGNFGKSDITGTVSNSKYPNLLKVTTIIANKLFRHILASSSQF